MDRSKIGQFFKDTFKKDDSNTPVKSGEIINFIFARYSYKKEKNLWISLMILLFVNLTLKVLNLSFFISLVFFLFFYE